MCIVSGHTDRIFDSCFLPNSDTHFCTVGVKHIKMWNLIGNTLKSNRGIFGQKGNLQTVLCCCPGNQENQIISGTMDGSVYVWNGNELETTFKPSNGPLYSINKYNDQYIVCGKFAHVSVWS